MLRHLLFWLLPPITLYFPTYTYFRQFWVKSQRSITLNNSKTRNGRVHICHSTRCWKSHLASDNYDSRGHFKSENRPKNYYCVLIPLLYCFCETHLRESFFLPIFGSQKFCAGSAMESTRTRFAELGADWLLSFDHLDCRTLIGRSRISNERRSPGT